jgi:hypothetical protein
MAALDTMATRLLFGSEESKSYASNTMLRSTPRPSLSLQWLNDQPLEQAINDRRLIVKQAFDVFD